MDRVLLLLVAASLVVRGFESGGPRAVRGNAAATAPATAHAEDPSARNAAGEVVVTFEKATVGKAVPTWTEKGVTFTLASPPQNSRQHGGESYFFRI